MATIQKRGEKYTVQIRKKGQKSVNATFARLFDAEAFARKTESEIERAEYTDRGATDAKTLADVLRGFRDGHATALKSGEQTQERINAILARWPDAEKISMTNIDQQLFTDYIAQRKRDKITGGTINREIGIMSSAINRAIAAGLPATNPIEKIDRPSENRARNRRLEHGELPRLLHQLRPRQRDSSGKLRAGVDNVYILWIVRFAIETAMRRSEIFALHWKDINLRSRVAKLHDTKNGEKRDVPLSTRACRVLRLLKATKAATEQRVFATTEAALKKCFERACIRAQIDDLHFHDLRHEATSRLATKLHMLELAAVTGHKDPRMLKRYFHPRAENLAKKLA